MTDHLEADRSSWPVVLLRAADAGPTYLSWTWLDNPASPSAIKLDTAQTSAALDLLDRALLAPLPLAGSSSDGDGDEYESREAAAHRALVTGAFTNLAEERLLSAQLTEAVLPETLRTELIDRADSHGAVHMRITPSPRLARVPWELLFVDAGRRLLDVAVITFDPPSTVHAERTVLPPRWAEVSHLPALHVLDPSLPIRAVEHGLGRTLAGLAKNALIRGISSEASVKNSSSHTRLNTSQIISRLDLSRQLHAPRSRFFYFGHVSSTADEPGSASIHLHDTVGAAGSASWGMAQPLRPRTKSGTLATARPDDHLPLSALDLLLGTQQCTDERVWALYASDGPQSGHEIWPVPTRVALIACEGGVDFRSVETFGLVIAMVDSGASLVTTTRWTLPTDHAFHSVAGVRRSVFPTVELALAVDRAHSRQDPIGLVHHWQREQLTKWESSPASIEHSPIVWAALTHTVAEARVPTSAQNRSGGVEPS
ncbi:hypothetical protein [Rhodococcus sp. 1168]|uniref:hypothetical protein n=1 Tax=Rhodococcus sp. 1168 TaxID=2018041 RepID=UPI000B5AD70C|nr:hypothetical protein [Rhodococcus sp. 1168]